MTSPGPNALNLGIMTSALTSRIASATLSARTEEAIGFLSVASGLLMRRP
jgi:hypothetical protein